MHTSKYSEQGSHTACHLRQCCYTLLHATSKISDSSETCLVPKPCCQGLPSCHLEYSGLVCRSLNYNSHIRLWKKRTKHQACCIGLSDHHVYAACSLVMRSQLLWSILCRPVADLTSMQSLLLTDTVT